MSVVRRVAGGLAAVLVSGVLANTPASAASVSRAALWGPSAASYGTQVTLTGYLHSSSGASLRGATVRIERSPRLSGAWSIFATRTVGTGNFSVAVTQTRGYDYRVRFFGSSSYSSSVSSVVYPAVLRKVSLDSIRTTSWETGSLRATGRVFPAPPAGYPVFLQRRMPSGAWKSIGLGRTAGGSSVSVSARAAGSVLTYRLYAPFYGGSNPYGAGVSKSVRHQHFVWRGVFRKAVLARGGTGSPHFTVIPAADAPYRSEADLDANRGGQVWADLNTSGCTKIQAYFANLTDGSVRVSLLRGSSTVAAHTMAADSEVDLNRPITGIARLRMQARDLTSATGPALSTDTRTLCNN